VIEMLRNARDIYGLRLLARDGNIGHVEDIIFDDKSWRLRYLVAKTGTWMIGRQVLIPPPALEGIEWWGVEGVRVNLTKQQIEESPDVSTAEPLSRGVERAYYLHFGWPFYWRDDAVEEPERLLSENNHLQSSREVDSYHVHATDGEIGHVTDLIFDETNWAIRYLVVDTRNWIPGRKVLITPDRVQRATAVDRGLHVNLTRETIKNAPAYDHDAPLDANYESALREYYDWNARQKVR
jgi:uncharacterized protein YrrD